MGTRRRILRIAEEAGYRPNPLAASLRTGRTGTIGVCLRDAETYLAHPQGSRNFWRICDIASRHGYRVSILIPGMQGIDSRTLDGCLLMNDRMEPELEDQLNQLAAEIPVMCLAGEIPGAISVQDDRYRELKAEFLELCCRRIVEHLSHRFRTMPFEPYQLVLKQLAELHYLVNRKRRGRGLPPVPKDSLRTKLKMVSPFERV